MLSPTAIAYKVGRISASTTPPNVTVNGTPVAVDALAVDSAGAISVSTGGLPYTAAGALATVEAAPTAFSQGIGFNAAGRVCIDTAGAITGYTGGLPQTATGALAVGF